MLLHKERGHRQLSMFIMLDVLNKRMGPIAFARSFRQPHLFEADSLLLFMLSDF